MYYSLSCQKLKASQYYQFVVLVTMIAKEIAQKKVGIVVQVQLVKSVQKAFVLAIKAKELQEIFEVNMASLFFHYVIMHYQL